MLIARIGSDGDGVGNAGDGKPWYLAGTLPDERIRASPVEKRGDGWAAVAESLIEASSERTAPPCRHFGACGGCALQHWQMQPYLAWKAGLLEAALRRAGYDPAIAPIHAAAARSRRRMDLAARRLAGAVVLGLHAPRSAEIVDLQTCEVLHPTLQDLLPKLRDVLRGLSLLRREAEIVVNLLDAGPDLLLRTDAQVTATDRVKLAAFAAANSIPRITVAHGHSEPETACLLRPAAIQLSGTLVIPPPGGFLQATSAGEAAIVACALAGLPERMPARARIAELFAGCGTLTFALAQRARIAAFEGDQGSLAALKAAANAAALAGRIEPQLRDLARQPLSAKELSAFAAVVLDPPHAGAQAQIAAIAESGIARVIYVSCNPTTLSRDANVLHGAGYRLLMATPIDQFLWSARLESVSVFAR